MSNGLDWLKDIDFYDLLDGDAALIADSCGVDILIKLLEELPSITLYLSTKPLTEARKRYIQKYYDGRNTKQLARLLNCSERFIFEAVAGQRKGIRDEGSTNA